MRRRVLLPLLLLLPAVPALSDWPQWRGPARDGVGAAFQAPAQWPPRLARRWRVPVGEGHASPLIAGGAAYVFARVGEQEIARRLDLGTGRVVWQAGYAAPYEMDPAARGHGKGPKSTPLIAGGRLYTLGINGTLSCLETAGGKVVWRHTFAGRYPQTAPQFGTAASPILEDGLLIAHVGGKDGGALTAFDPATGRERWRWAGDGPGYATPIVVTAGGLKQIVTQTQKRVVALGLDGKLLWSLPFTTPYEQNSVTPVAVGDRILLGGTQQPTFAVRPRRNGAAWTAERLWQTRDATLYMSTPVVLQGRVYGMSERYQGQLFALDPATGKVGWTGAARLGDNAALAVAGGAVLALTTDGSLRVSLPEGAGLREVAKYQVGESAVWASPALSGKSLLVKDVDHLTRWDVL